MLRRRTSALHEARTFQAALPAGLFSLESYRRFVAEALRANGLSDDFRQLPRPVLIPATDLDSGERIVFGAPPWDDVPISAAVVASSAIPAFFEPVEIRGRQLIDGDIGRAAHLDVALLAGATDILIVSPMAAATNVLGPFDVPGEPPWRGSLRDGGMWTIFSQAQRIEHRARLQLGIERARLAAPGLRLQVIEPDLADAAVFLANPMSLAARADVLARGYAAGVRAFAPAAAVEARPS